MNQSERRQFLIRWLLQENPSYCDWPVPQDTPGQKKLLRSLMNIRPPRPIDQAFLQVQDEYLQEELRRRTVTEWRTLTPIGDGLYLWRGDITTLRCACLQDGGRIGRIVGVCTRQADLNKGRRIGPG